MHKTMRLTRSNRGKMQEKMETMHALRNHIQEFGENARRLAVAMVLHKRLGQDAGLSVLSAELVRMVVEHAMVPEPIKYEMKYFY
jgi:hypothetical protein